uniref:Lysosomal dipeptide transporter MFSD1 n=1 Tax=Strombidium rassoulzadegani TaxID=1082188 RepID=A0A7S3CLB5_9SPIT|mmetsp:Transcript_12568/g.21155  ORF Transcript_12568/g.21155 Transcript_12568/m.21155 type:complete len:387 (+) Transcript_12568:439-1599(+)
MNYPLMIVGRVVFGLGGESMSVAQSSIISVWFKGKELAFALGFNLSVSRLGSVINSNTIPQLYDAAPEDNKFGLPFFVGFLICVFSLVNAVGIVLLDLKAEKLNPRSEKLTLGDDDKFKFSDLMKFKLPFWLLTGSCVVTYMSVFPYIQISSKLLQDKYGFDKDMAGKLFSVPYLISAISSPFLGFFIDRIGRRALLISVSSVILITAYSLSMVMPSCDQCYNEMYPLVLTGVGYSIYASAIWGSVPYTVLPQTVGSAFGICTAIQNIGLVVAPLIVAKIHENTTRNFGYFWVCAFFVAINVVGLLLNLTLYYVDRKYYDGVLDKVESDDRLTQLMSTPNVNLSKKEIMSRSMAKTRTAQNLLDYKLEESNRESLKRSFATKRPYQ